MRTIKTESRAERIGMVILYFFMVLLFIIMVYPFWHVVMYAVSDSMKASRGGIFLWPRSFTLDAVTSLAASSGLLKAYGNTLFRVVVGTLVNMLVTVPYAYAISRKSLAGRSFFSFLALFTMVFSGGMIPTYLVIVEVGLFDSIWALILPCAMNVYYMLILRTFFKGIPDAIEESARIDGASHFTSFVCLMVPLAIPSIATIALFNIVDHFSAYLDGVLYISSSKNKVLQVYLRELVNSYSVAALGDSSNFSDLSNRISGMSVQMAAVVITCLPVFCLYPLVQRFYINGMMVGSVKG